ncbi:MAG TPA: fumarylacetoacetate hydrolase family protein [Ktedonobacteraceae bacterium]|nr:fumarylacetoacetate hydrolase family protein [Ktedonobacteraceae bacterium]
MKLARLLYDGPDGKSARLVVVQPEAQRSIDLATAERLRLERQGATHAAALRIASALFPASMADALSTGEPFLAAARLACEQVDAQACSPLSDARFLPPLDPPLIRDFLAFAQHIRNAGERMGHPPADEVFKRPVYYKGNPSTLIGHEQEVPWPNYCDWMDYELELGLVIGKTGRNLSPGEALSHLFGVTIFNDFSARDIQRLEMSGGLGPAKGKDFATSLGPWIVTRDELDLADLGMVARVNGMEWSRGTTASITWKIEELIAYASKGESIQPGELLGSGTVGFGCGMELGRRLQPGDVVELEVDGIGVLRNRIGLPEPRGWEPQARTTAFPV